VAAVSNDNLSADMAQVWDVDSRLLVGAFAGAGTLDEFGFSPAGDLLFTRTNPGADTGKSGLEQFKVWATRGQRSVVAPGHGTVAAAPDGSRVLLVPALDYGSQNPGGFPVQFRVPTIDRPTMLRDAHKPLGATAAACSHDGKLWAVAGGGSLEQSSGFGGKQYPATPAELELFDGEGHRLHEMGVPPGVIKAVAFSADGRWLAAAILTKRTPLQDKNTTCVRIWDAEQWAAVRDIDLAVGVEFLRLTPDGAGLVLVTEGKGGKKVCLYDTNTRTMTWEHPPRVVPYVVQPTFSVDSKQLLVPSAFGVIAYDAATGAQVYQFTGHFANVHCVAVHPGGRRAATGAADGTIKLWDIPSGQDLLTLKAHAGPVTFLEFTKDGNQLISAGADNRVRWWDAPPVK
jgi:WD40 repeat protein